MPPLFLMFPFIIICGSNNGSQFKLKNNLCCKNTLIIKVHFWHVKHINFWHYKNLISFVDYINVKFINTSLILHLQVFKKIWYILNRFHVLMCAVKLRCRFINSSYVRIFENIPSVFIPSCVFKSVLWLTD